MSLEYGGVFDIFQANKWQSQANVFPHKEHRKGRNADIDDSVSITQPCTSTTGSSRPLTPAEREEFLLRAHYVTGVATSIYENNNHFHIRY